MVSQPVWTLLVTILIFYYGGGIVDGQDLLGQMHAAELAFYRSVGWTVPPGHPLAAPQHLLEKYDPYYKTTPATPTVNNNQAVGAHQPYQPQGGYRQQPYGAQPQQPTAQWQQPQPPQQAQQWQLPSAQQTQWPQPVPIQSQHIRQQSQQLPLPYSAQQGVSTHQYNQPYSQAVLPSQQNVYYPAQPRSPRRH